MPKRNDIGVPARRGTSEIGEGSLAPCRHGNHSPPTTAQRPTVPGYDNRCAFDWEVAPALTRHAATRLRQRAITVEQVLMIIDFGKEQRAHGASRFFLDKGARHRLTQAQPCALRELGSLDIQVVMADDGRLITAAHRTKRLRRDIQRTYRRIALQ